jgi:hypothetical protein
MKRRPRASRASTLAGEWAWLCEAAAEEERAGAYPLTQYQRDPVAYVRKRLHIAILMPHQIEILDAVARAVAGEAPPRVAVRSGQKSGKTATVVWLALWFFECFDNSEVLMCAAIESQTRGVLWKALTQAITYARSCGTDIDGQLSRSPATGMVSNDSLRLIRSISGRDIEALAGVSGRQLVIVDEASHLPEEKLQAFEGNQMGAGKGEMGGAVVLISNPTANAGPFYEAFHGAAQRWQTFHVDCEKVADWQEKQGIRIPFTATRDKIEEAREYYKEDSAFWYWRVKGEFLRNETGRAMPMIRIEMAIARWPEAVGEGVLRIGWDVAGDGVDADENAWAVVRGKKCLAIVRRRGITEESALGETYALLDAHRVPNEIPQVVVDAEGPTGSAYYGRLRAEAERRASDPKEMDRRFEVYPVRGSSRFVRDKFKFDRLRDELIWVLSQWLLEGAVPNDLKLQQELYAPVWEPNANGKLVASSKVKLREKLGRSPDSLDALANAVREPTGAAAIDEQPAIDPYEAAHGGNFRRGEAFDVYRATQWWKRGR